MEVKRYRGTDMAEILGRVRQELGQDAVILSQRKVRAPGLRGVFSKRQIEVMVAHERYEKAGRGAGKAREAAKAGQEGPEARGQEAQPAQPAQAAVEPAAPAFLAAKPAEVPLAAILQTPAEPDLSAFMGIRDDVRPILEKLIQEEVDPALAQALGREASGILGHSLLDAYGIVRRTMVKHFGEPAPIQVTKGKQKVVLLAGPSGMGKTTSAVKLAAQILFKENAKVAILNADTYRVGAKEQIQIYADILQVPIRMIYTMEDIERAMQELSDRDVIVVDTAGKNPTDEKYKEDMMNLLQVLRPQEVFLVLSASTGNRICREMIHNFSFLTQYKLIITKMDEALSAHLAYNACRYAGMPVSYLTWGQRVPDDIEAADPVFLAGSLLGSDPA